MEDKQLLPEGEIFEDEILAGTEDADQPTQQMPEPHTHGENHIEQLPVEPVAKSLDLRMHDVLRTHRGDAGVMSRVGCNSTSVRTS